MLELSPSFTSYEMEAESHLQWLSETDASLSGLQEAEEREKTKVNYF